MSDKDNTLNLFSIINGCLPYEYNVVLLDDRGRSHGILIAKEDSDYFMQITPSTHDNTCTVLVWTEGDDPDTDGEVYQWDLDSPDFTLDDILTDIKNRI